MASESLSDFGVVDEADETPTLEIRPKERNHKSGCVCPDCEQNIGPTHGEFELPVSAVFDSRLRDALEERMSTVAVNGWECEDCNIIAPRNMESSNSVWFNKDNRANRFSGVAVQFTTSGGVIVPILSEEIPPGFEDEFGIVCPSCGIEYPGCCVEARAPCAVCRGDTDRHTATYSKPWNENWSRQASVTGRERETPEYGRSMRSF